MRAKGIDISKWQGSFEDMGNIDFIIQKVSEGTVKDALYDELLPAVKTIERRGGYHYFRTEIDPVQQADFFFNAQAGQGFKWLAVDYEHKNNVLDAQGEYNLSVFYNELCALTDKPVLLYCGIYTYRDNVIAYNVAWDNAVPYWISRFQYTEDGQLPNNPDLTIDDVQVRSPDNWMFWQWEAKGNDKGEEYGVGSDDIDMDVFNGTVEELDAWLSLEEPVSPNGENCCEELKSWLIELDAQMIHNFRDLINSDELLHNKIELNGIDLDGQSGEIERLYDIVAELTADIGILRAREIAHTQEAHEELEVLYHEVEAVNAYIHGRLDDLLEKYAELEAKQLELEEIQVQKAIAFETMRRQLVDITIQCDHVHPKFFKWLGWI